VHSPISEVLITSISAIEKPRFAGAFFVCENATCRYRDSRKQQGGRRVPARFAIHSHAGMPATPRPGSIIGWFVGGGDEYALTFFPTIHGLYAGRDL
jgi:hypothetical protein